MTNNQLQNNLVTIAALVGILSSVMGAIAYLQQMPVYWTIFLLTICLIGLNLYLRFSEISSTKSGSNEPRYPRIYGSKISLYSLFVIPILSIGICFTIYFWNSVETWDTGSLKLVSEIKESPCETSNIANRSICVAKFSPDAFDSFSQSLIIDLSGKTSPDEVRVIEHDKFVYSGRNEEKQIDSIQYTHCVDTGIVVHGIRSSRDSVFYCKVHFLNYERRDTLIKNPDQIEFSYKGHVKFLSNFLLAQNESSNKDYQYALDLFLDAKSFGLSADFIAIVDNHIGNMDYNLDDLDSAKMYYDLASGDSSAVYDYAIEKLFEIGLENRDALLGKSIIRNDAQSNNSDGPRIKIVSMLNKQFKTHASKYFRTKERHEDSVRFGEFVDITANSWDPQKTYYFVSKWLLYRYDSLYYFEMRTRVHDESVLEPSFKSWLAKKWSVSAMGQINIDFALRSARRHTRAGWDVVFRRSKNSQKMDVSRVSYQYLYSPVIAREDPRQKLFYVFVRNEAARVEMLDDKLRKLLSRYRLRFTLNSRIEVEDLEQ